MKLGIISFVFESPDRLYMIQLMQESSFLTEGIARRLADKDFFDFTRINFLCKDEVKEDKVKLSGPIAEMDVIFDGEYFKMDKAKKTDYLYELAYSAFEKLCSVKGWDYTLFKNCIDEIKAEGEEHIFKTGLTAEKDGKKAELIGIQTMEKVEFAVEIDGKRRKVLATTKPNEIDYFVTLGKLVWESSGKLVLYDKGGNKVEK